MPFFCYIATLQMWARLPRWLASRERRTGLTCCLVTGHSWCAPPPPIFPPTSPPPSPGALQRKASQPQQSGVGYEWPGGRETGEDQRLLQTRPVNCWGALGSGASLYVVTTAKRHRISSRGHETRLRRAAFLLARAGHAAHRAQQTTRRNYAMHASQPPTKNSHAMAVLSRLLLRALSHVSSPSPSPSPSPLFHPSPPPYPSHAHASSGRHPGFGVRRECGALRHQGSLDIGHCVVHGLRVDEGLAAAVIEDVRWHARARGRVTGTQ